MTQPYENMGEQIAQIILDHKGVQDVCSHVAQERSGVGSWTPEEWEANEDTPRYDLYWSVYTETQVKIVVSALNKIANVQVT